MNALPSIISFLGGLALQSFIDKQAVSWVFLFLMAVFTLAYATYRHGQKRGIS